MVLRLIKPINADQRIELGTFKNYSNNSNTIIQSISTCPYDSNIFMANFYDNGKLIIASSMNIASYNKWFYCSGAILMELN